MITITIIGSDRYVVGEYSRDVTKKLASLLEAKEEEILFLAPEYYVYHNGVEQTSYQAVIEVRLPEKYRPFEKNVAEFIKKTASEFVVHLSLRFIYFKGKTYDHIHYQYPRYITEENEVLIEGEEYDEDTEIYEGNIFENFEERLASSQAGQGYEEDGECEDDCDCDDDCECEEGHCKCGHHHHH